MTYHFLMVNRCQLLMHRFNLWFVLAYSLWEMPVCGQTITHNLNQGLEISRKCHFETLWTIITTFCHQRRQTRDSGPSLLDDSTFMYVHQYNCSTCTVYMYTVVTRP